MEQKSMSRRKLLKLMGLGAAATTLAACQPEAVEKVVTKEVEKEVEKVVKETVEVEREVTREVEKEAEQVALEGELYWDTFRGPGTGWNEERINSFKNMYPDVEITLRPLAGASQQDNYAKMYAMQAAGDLGDIVAFDPSHYHFRRAIGRDIIAPLDDFVAEEAPDFLDQWFETFIDIQYYEGQIYGLPSWGWTGWDSLIINVRHFEEAGIEPPEPTSHDTSMEQIAEWAREFYEDGERFGLAASYRELLFTVLCRCFNSYFINEEGTECLIVDDENAKQAMKWLYDLAVEDQILPRPGEIDDFNDAQTANRLTMQWSGSLGVRNVKTAVDEEGIEDTVKVSQILFPEREDGRYPTQIRGGTWNINKDSQYPRAGWEFLKHITNTEGCVGFNLVAGNGALVRPDVLDVLIARDAIHEWFIPNLENGIGARPPGNWRGREYTATIQQYGEIMMDPERGIPFEEGLTDLYDKVQEVLDMERP